MGNNKSQLVVAAIENGTVIDHIPAEKTYQVVNLLQLEKMETPVTIGYNLPSKKIGNKCITNNEPMQTLFHTVDKVLGIVRCHYCDKEQQLDKVELCK